MYKLNTQTSSKAVDWSSKDGSNGEEGMVSILVTMIIMVILSLIVIGFAQISRREQRQSVDRQLYSQASYAAETGINDAQTYIKAQLASGSPIASNDKCSNSTVNTDATPAGTGSAIVPGSNASSTCVLINAEPTEAIWQHVDSQTSVAFPFTPAIAASSGIVFAWQDSDTVASNYLGCPSVVPATGAFLPQTGAGSWTCQAGALRVDLTPISGAMTRDTLIENTKNFVIYPVSGVPTTASYATALGHGGIVAAGCSTATSPRHCQVTITGATGNFYIRIRPIYRAANVEITTQSGGIGLIGAQAVVDVTGRATDILKRLQVRVPISSINTTTNTTFDYAAQSIDSFCKMYAVIPGAPGPSPAPIADTAPVADTSCSVL